MILEEVEDLLVDFGVTTPEAKLMLEVLYKAMDDLNHKRKEIREDARQFLFDWEDDGLDNMMDVLGLDGQYVKKRLRVIYRGQLNEDSQ